MLEIKKLNKIYFSNNQETVALKNINLNFDNKGLVFILGKSGSGKSTLLNMIGTLDKPTSGQIFFKNKDILSLSNNEQSSFRKNEIGFIFQDCCLVDSLNVEDNILVTLNLENKKIDLSSLLKEFDLEGFEKRKISTLSAGQKQRVAILRAYIKSPSILLADEPTGNLDYKSSQTILNLLKKLSKEKLVIIVSHNNDDAYQFGDRIIEIKDGEITNDITKQDNVSIKNKTIYLSNVDSLNDDELEQINLKIRNQEITSISTTRKLFKGNNDNTYKSDENYVEKENRSTFKGRLKLSLKVLKRNLVSLFVSSFLVALVVSLFGISQMFVIFSPSQVMEDSLKNNNQNTFGMKKGVIIGDTKTTVDLSKLQSVTEDDINAVKNKGYTDRQYTLMNYSLPISMKYWTLQNELTINDSANLEEFYLQEAYGVLPIDEEYLKTVFKDKYAIISNTTIKDGGIYITDYIADSIINFRSSIYPTYESLLTYYKNNLGSSTFAYINGIIKTNYLTRHQKLLDMFKDSTTYPISEIRKTNEYLAFVEEVKSTLGLTYALTPNFVNACKNAEYRNFARLDYSTLNFSKIKKIAPLNLSYALYNDVYSPLLEENTLGIALNELNRLLDTKLTIEQANAFLSNEEIVYIKYSVNDYKNMRGSLNIKMKAFETQEFSYISSKDLFPKLRSLDMINYSLFYTNLSKASIAFDALIDRAFVPLSSYAEAAVNISNVVKVFSDFFVLVAVILILIAAFIICLFTFSTISKHKKDIGIFKSLGIRNKDITRIFSLHILIEALTSVLIFSISIYLFTMLSNTLLFNAFMSYLNNPALKTITILNFNAGIEFIDIGVILAISLIAIIIPSLFNKKITPLEMIR